MVRQPRNLDPSQHPFERAREYTRALNAVKMERLFAAPFLGQMGEGHVDGVYTMAKDPGSLERFASGSGDGVVKVWDLTTQGEVWNNTAHENIVKGVCWTPDRKLLSCAADKTIKLFDPYNSSSEAPPLATYLGQGAFTSLTHHRDQPFFAASSSQISIYDLSRPSSTPSQTLHWPTSVDTITSVAFNQTETSVLASTAIDRSIVLYDLRTSSPLSKLVLRLASNAISWNPMEAFNFAVANEDHNVYLFDMRKMDRALNVLKDHVAAVMDVDFSPTGEELVSASYDRTIRLWNRATGHSRDIYHTQRMQRSVISKYFLNAKHETNSTTVCFRPSLLPIINTFYLVRTMVTSDYGVPTHPTAVGLKVPAREQNWNTTKPLLRGTPICQRSNGSNASATFLELSRRLVRLKRRSLLLLRGARRTFGSMLRRALCVRDRASVKR